MRRLLFVAGAVLLGGAAVFAVLYAGGYVRFVYPDRDVYPVWGLDVSHHQRRIDWPTVAEQDFAFVYVKATEGGDFRDSLFARNWEEAGRAGLARGAYHFFRFCTPAADQARNFLDAIPPDGELPPAIDVEYGGNCSEVPPREVVVARLDSVAAAVEAAFGQPPVLYALPDAYDDFVAGRFPDHPIWINSKFSEPDLPDGRPWTIWQFHTRHRLDGVPAFVDLNAFSGSRAAFQHFLRTPPADRIGA